jgi:phage baseplate assembly protein V
MGLNRILQPIKNKIMLLIGRGILTAITNSGKTQKIQITGFSGETLSELSRMQPYGFETYPVIDGNTETLNVYYNGNRDLGFNLICHNRDLRPTDLNDGDVCVWSKDSANSNTNRITIKSTDEIEIKTKDGHKIILNNSGVEINTADTNSDININGGTGTCNIDCGKINLGAAAATDGVIKGTSYQTPWDVLFGLLQTHVHDSPQAPSGTLVTAPPTGGAGWTNPLTNNISTDVKTK